MKIRYVWNEEYRENELEIQLHPVNRELVDRIEKSVQQKAKLELIDPKNERVTKVESAEIFMIEAMDHLSKVYTIEDKVYYIKGRLKDFEKWKKEGLFRINNSVILNLAEIDSFKNGQYARLEIYTKNGQTFTVSRHYAKQIKEELQ